MPNKGQFRYDSRLERRIQVRVTPTQASSLTAMANAMSLTVADVLRFGFDQLVEDIPEPRLFTRKVRVQFK